jgi:uncharacterized membrane protein YgcG
LFHKNNEMKKLLLSVLLIGLSVIGFAQAPETLQHSSTSYVDDYAKMFTPEQAQNLDHVIRAFHDTVQISLVTVNDLAGLEPAEYATKLGNKWGVGSHSNNGLLILICPSLHKFFAATGGGIQGDLTDLKCASIYNELGKPKYKSGDFYGGTMDVLNKYINVLSPSAKEFRSKQEAAEALISQKKNSEMLANFGYGVLVLAIIGFIIFGFIYSKRKREQAERELNTLKKQFKSAADDARSLQVSFEKSLDYEEGVKLKNLFFAAKLNERMDTNWKKADYADFIKRYDNFTHDKNTNQLKGELDRKITAKANAAKEAADAAQRKADAISNASKALRTYDKTYFTRLEGMVEEARASFKTLVFDKTNYCQTIENLYSIITQINLAIGALGMAHIAQDEASITKALKDLKTATSKFDNLMENGVSKVMSAETEKINIAKSAKVTLEKELANREAYTTQKGVSQATAGATRQQCATLRNRLAGFDGLSLLEMYALYQLLSPMLKECEGAKRESDAYGAEQRRLAQVEAQRQQAIRDEEARVRRAEEDRKRRIRDEEAAAAAAVLAAAARYSSSSSSSSSSSYDSSFGGGSFDGGGGGGDW